jgi:ABC-type glycerol-3-phosphate transport system permease component
MGVAKIMVMLVSVALQIWIMRGFFKNTGVSYTEVAT